MDIITTYLPQKTVSELPVEFVERKGKGHPDSICDSASEEASIALSKYYLNKYGRILHHNVDKAVLAGGQSRVTFGGGEVIVPIYLLLVGRAVKQVDSEQISVDDIVVRAVNDWIGKEMRFLKPDVHIVIDTKIRPGSPDLVKNFEKSYSIPSANDTSFGVGFAPFTDTELVTLKVEQHLNSPKIKDEYPAIGEDIKVMSIRKENTLKLTIACALISKFISNVDEYEKYKNIVKKEVEYIVEQNTKLKPVVTVNAADEYKKGIYYLTVTGTSSEHGDDGQVGRGNRFNGLITPYRNMTLEATTGKNPLTHPGKLYSIASQRICNKILEESEDVKEVYCYMVSKIGNPITEPNTVHLKIIPYNKGPDEGTIQSIVNEVVEQVPHLWKDIIEKKISLF